MDKQPSEAGKKLADVLWIAFGNPMISGEELDRVALALDEYFESRKKEDAPNANL